MEQPTRSMLPDGRRMHLSHGPIDLIIQADGAPDEVAAAHEQAAARFRHLLPELCEELPLLRTMVAAGPCPLAGPVARRMWAAAVPHLPTFITPMAAVAGAVADEVLTALVAGRRLDRAAVNNGGDMALYIAPGQSWRVGVVVDPLNPRRPAGLEITHAMRPRGIATSGRGGRSHTLGIADSVTVLAGDAATADAASTLAANAVDLPGHPGITRVPACELAPDSDLGDRPVTVSVGPLTEAEQESALDAGTQVAARMVRQGLIKAAFLVLGTRMRVVGQPDGVLTAPERDETREEPADA
ncbi:UPF0280 family protein [Caenispirillum salinarum]|uniref:UPF0280 family protein n=1 Tax=Caenispirillum salinarum TaxID=859058 RepID=UPI00384ABE7F